MLTYRHTTTRLTTWNANRLTKIQCFSEAILQLPEDDTMVLKHVGV